ncbi:aspartate/glutamate racemase family protein [Aquipseudomonas ullengensis]|uniref:Aspartate/glutamate racemase family protein n=1 Tax=Aquipseudomonas ullengensis TaxID=2759166 RepID=A0A7W4LKA3_9GAMM|nr:aspartate/glutamate racemase family protein [Pseudomonas ullengensis]MBB2494706.1 aspartate/glutamate racemase family protein [Pseudomonas ullengensis]
MRIQLINPNTTRAFTERLQHSAQLIAAAGTEVFATQPRLGTPSVESHVDEAWASLGVIAQVQDGEANGVDAYVVACFGDTGVAAAREVARGPVIGMTEAALFSACLLGASFSIITLPPRTLIHARRVLNECGLQHRCAGLRAIDVQVDDCQEEDNAALYQALLDEAHAALAHDRCEVLILGCAGLSEMVEPLQQALGIPVIDGVCAALKMAEGLVAMGLKTSKHSSFDFPPRDLRAQWPGL